MAGWNDRTLSGVSLFFPPMDSPHARAAHGHNVVPLGFITSHSRLMYTPKRSSSPATRSSGRTLQWNHGSYGHCPVGAPRCTLICPHAPLHRDDWRADRHMCARQGVPTGQIPYIVPIVSSDSVGPMTVFPVISMVRKKKRKRAYAYMKTRMKQKMTGTYERGTTAKGVSECWRECKVNQKTNSLFVYLHGLPFFERWRWKLHVPIHPIECFVVYEFSRAMHGVRAFFFL